MNFNNIEICLTEQGKKYLKLLNEYGLVITEEELLKRFASKPIMMGDQAIHLELLSEAMYNKEDK